MAEICSTYPSAGSVYHWAGMLAPPGQASAFAAYITGWFNFLGNAAGDASFAFGFAFVISSAVGYSPSQYDPVMGPGPGLSVGATVGVAMLGCFVWALCNALRVDQQGWINNFAAAWQIVTTVVIVICILVMPPKDPDVPSNWVWNTSYNGTGVDQSNFGYVMLLGLLYACFSFSGYEAGAHMAEETQNAAVSSPWGVVATCCTVAMLGFIYIIGLMYATTASLGLSYADWAARVIGSDDDYGTSVSGYLTAAMSTVAGYSSVADLYVAACGLRTGQALIAVLVVSGEREGGLESGGGEGGWVGGWVGGGLVVCKNLENSYYSS